MKDSKGHGSDARGANAEAAASLANNHPKAFVAPVHPSMGVAGKKLEPGKANEILHDTNSHDRDFHTLRSDQTLRLADYAKQFGYRKSATSPGSTARAFHAHLSNRRAKDIRASNAAISRHYGTKK